MGRGATESKPADVRNPEQAAATLARARSLMYLVGGTAHQRQPGRSSPSAARPLVPGVLLARRTGGSDNVRPCHLGSDCLNNTPQLLSTTNLMKTTRRILASSRFNPSSCPPRQLKNWLCRRQAFGGDEFSPGPLVVWRSDRCSDVANFAAAGDAQAAPSVFLQSADCPPGPVSSRVCPFRRTAMRPSWRGKLRQVPCVPNTSPAIASYPQD